MYLKERLGQNIVLHSDRKIDLRQHSPGKQLHYIYIYRETWANGDQTEVDFVLVGCKHKFQIVQ